MGLSCHNRGVLTLLHVFIAAAAAAATAAAATRYDNVAAGEAVIAEVPSGRPAEQRVRPATLRAPTQKQDAKGRWDGVLPSTEVIAEESDLKHSRESGEVAAAAAEDGYEVCAL